MAEEFATESAIVPAPNASQVRRVAFDADPAWPFATLADICLKIGSGATPTGGAEAYLESRERFALVRSQNVFDRRFDRQGLAFITDHQAERLRGVHLQSEDLLLNITGDGVTFGRACLLPSDVLPACVNQHVAIIRVNRELAEPGYVLAFLTHPETKHYIESFNAGGSRRAITKGHIQSFRLPMPPRIVQCAVARILGTLDDKIELNRRMNETLEEMARALFKSWFVDFDPVHAKAAGKKPYGMDDATANMFPSEIVASQKGTVPNGWSRVPLGEAMTLKRGYDLPKDDRRPGAVPVCSSSGVSGFHDESKVHGPGVVTGRYGTVGQVFFLAEDFWPLNTTLYVSAFKLVVPRIAYYLLRCVNFAHYSDKAAVPGINRNHVHREEIIVPPRPIQVAFDVATEPLSRLADARRRESVSLVALRDTLLPKVLSGELRIKDAEKMVGEAT